MSQSELLLAPLDFVIMVICGFSTPWVESVTGPWLSEDITGFSGVDFDLFAQMSEENFEVFGLLDIIAAPHSQFFDLR